MADSLAGYGMVMAKRSRKSESTEELEFGGSTTTIKTGSEYKSLRTVPISGMPKRFMHCENRRSCGAFTDVP
jgi:hypothetical protein